MSISMCLLSVGKLVKRRNKFNKTTDKEKRADNSDKQWNNNDFPQDCVSVSNKESCVSFVRKVSKLLDLDAWFYLFPAGEILSNSFKHNFFIVGKWPWVTYTKAKILSKRSNSHIKPSTLSMFCLAYSNFYVSLLYVDIDSLYLDWFVCWKYVG